jgi:hypothetical protein
VKELGEKRSEGLRMRGLVRCEGGGCGGRGRNGGRGGGG